MYSSYDNTPDVVLNLILKDEAAATSTTRRMKAVSGQEDHVGFTEIYHFSRVSLVVVDWCTNAGGRGGGEGGARGHGGGWTGRRSDVDEV